MTNIYSSNSTYDKYAPNLYDGNYKSFNYIRTNFIK